jgi:hypothetical protein
MENNMKKFKGTPGKWYVQFMDKENPESDFWVKSDENPKVHYGTDIMQDDYGEHNGYPREQRLADAKLIAESPELLKQLTVMTALCRLKYGNIDKDVYTEILKSEDIINKILL